LFQIERLNATVLKLMENKGANTGMSSEVNHQFTTLKRDVEELQSSSAKAEATLSSTQQIILKTIKEMKKDVDASKIEALNPVSTQPIPQWAKSRKKVTIWHCILSAELTKTHSFRLFFLAILPTGKLLIKCTLNDLK